MQSIFALTDEPPAAGEVMDFIGVGFGPSNLSFAIAAQEMNSGLRGLFFERRDRFEWHPGILLDGSRMQISFLKDLVTLRNPASPFTFLQYLKAKERLERFVNLNEFQPTRLEYQDYLQWAAQTFSGQVRYGTAVSKITPVRLGSEPIASLFRVLACNAETHESTVHWTRNIVHAPGGTPRIPQDGVRLSDRVIHSSEFLHRFPQDPAFRAAENQFAVVGDGQSAGEIVAHLLQWHPRAQIHFFIGGYAPRPSDNSPFVNEAFFSGRVDSFYTAMETERTATWKELRNSNYGVIEGDLIKQIYRGTYLDDVRGRPRLRVHPFSELVSAWENDNRIELATKDRASGQTHALKCDRVVLATGYTRRLDPEIFGDVLPWIATTDSEEMPLSRAYRIETAPEISAGIYVQGLAERSHGLGDTLLSLLAFRSYDICVDIRDRAGDLEARGCGRMAPTRRSTKGEYPPKRHLETDPEKIYRVIERYKFATLISASGSKPYVTQVPLILDRKRGKKGVLFGHMDRSNPHCDLLENGPMLAVFHGPNAYISPHVYQTSQLPTWNSVSVHVTGKLRIIECHQELVRGLMRISEEADQRPGAFRLRPDDPRITRLIEFIVGFEIEIEEIVGRFKLSQDREEADRLCAAKELANQAGADDRCLVAYLAGCPDLR